MNMAEGLRRDVTVGLRGLGRQPGFAIAFMPRFARYLPYSGSLTTCVKR